MESCALFASFWSSTSTLAMSIWFDLASLPSVYPCSPIVSSFYSISILISFWLVFCSFSTLFDLSFDSCCASLLWESTLTFLLKARSGDVFWAVGILDNDVFSGVLYFDFFLSSEIEVPILNLDAFSGVESLALRKFCLTAWILLLLSIYLFGCWLGMRVVAEYLFLKFRGYAFIIGRAVFGPAAAVALEFRVL